MTSVRSGAALAVALLLLAACSTDGDDDGGASAPVVPQYATVPCVAPVPVDPRVECGELTVPADRAAPEAGGVTLPVAIVRSAAPAPAPDPIVHIGDGPGLPTVAGAAFFLASNVGGDRDVVLVDQRGTGGAEPSLDCPELTAVAVENGLAADSVVVEDARTDAAMLRCRDALVADGVDLDQYDSTAIATDVADLRRQLGFEQWNVWAQGYGTVVAQELLRTDEEGIRSAVLDSPMPLSIAIGQIEDSMVYSESIPLLFTKCGEDPGCRTFPILSEELAVNVRASNEAPFSVRATGPTGVEGTFVVTGVDLVNGLISAMGDTALLPSLPSLISGLRHGPDAHRVLVEQSFPDADVLHEAQARSVLCADQARMIEGSGPFSEPRPEHEHMTPFTGRDEDARSAAWGVEWQPAFFNTDVASAVPVLLLAGELDPRSPGRYAERIVGDNRLPNATSLRLPGLSHGVVFASPCGAALLQAFVASPAPGTFDQSCVATLGPVAWVVP